MCMHADAFEVEVEDIKIGPAARKLAREKGLRLSDLRATGPKGIITKEDVLQATLPPDPVSVASPSTPRTEKGKSKEEKPKTTPPTDYRDIPLTQMRRVIAQRVLQAKTTIPGIYFSIDCDITEVQQLRETLKSAGAKVRPISEYHQLQEMP